MRLKSFEELDCLLPEEEREIVRFQRMHKVKNTRRPSSMRTKNRVLPLLPKWMKKKLIEAKGLYGHSFSDFYDDWNHTITLPLDSVHDITFSIIDSYNHPNILEEEINILVEVYKKLQILYRNYGHPLTLISMHRSDFGMCLPYTFYNLGNIKSKSFHLPSVNKEEVSNLLATATQYYPQYYTRIFCLETIAKEYIESKNENERVMYNTWFACEHKKMTDYLLSLRPVVERSTHQYFIQPNLETIDLYMNKTREWTRELCIKWQVGEDISRLKKLDALRSGIDEIIKLTQNACFSFGVKTRNSAVTYCDNVNQFNHLLTDDADLDDLRVY